MPTKHRRLMKQSSSTGWFDLPFEMREMVIDRMDPKTRSRFAQCSKQCGEEVDGSGSYMHEIKAYDKSYKKLSIYFSRNEKSGFDRYYFWLDFHESEKQTIVVDNCVNLWLKFSFRSLVLYYFCCIPPVLRSHKRRLIYRTGWFDLPCELHDKMILDMTTESRCKFQRCSKSCLEQVKRSKKGIWHIGISGENCNGALLLFMAYQEFSRCNVWFEFYRESRTRTKVVYKSINRKSQQLVEKWAKVERGTPQYVRTNYFKKYLEKYKCSIKSIAIENGIDCYPNFEFKKLKRLEEIEMDLGDLEVDEIPYKLECKFLDNRQLKKFKILNMPQILLTFEQLLAFNGETISISLDGFDEHKMISYLEVLKSHEHLKSLKIQLQGDSEINIRGVVRTIDVMEYSEDQRGKCEFNFESDVRENGKFKVVFDPKREFGVEWKEGIV